MSSAEELEQKLKNHVVEVGDGFVTWDDSPESMEKAFSHLSNAYDKVFINASSEANRSNATDIFRHISPGISVTDTFTRDDYDYFRPEEAMPRSHREMVKKCDKIYWEHGIANHLISLMSEFVSQGARLVHESPEIQKQCRSWWKLIKGSSRSERFTSLLLRKGTVITVRQTGKFTPRRLKKILKNPDEQQYRAFAAKEFPTRYWFYGPDEVDCINPELAKYSTSRAYGLKLTSNTLNILKKLKRKNAKITKEQEHILKGMPSFIRDAEIINNKNMIVLPHDKTRDFHYKKDDSEIFGHPITQSMIHDFQVLSKAKLADLRALDGATSRIVHFKIGSLDKDSRLIPGESVLRRFENIVMNAANNGGVLNLITGPEVDFKESSGDAAKFLGEAKYAPIIAAILAAFGVPSTLVGGSSPGMMNNLVSVKALLKRLIFIRETLVEFWEQEIRLFQRAMGHQKPAQLYFDHMSLTDDDSIKALLVQLVDRKILSAESVQEAFNFIPEIEDIRIKRQQQRPERDRPVSAFSDAQPDLAMTKLFVSRGEVTPSEVGLELQPRKEGEFTLKEVQADSIKQRAQVSTKNKQGVSGEGRPKTSYDQTKRKTRVAASISDPLYDKLIDLYKEVYSVSNLSESDIMVVSDLYFNLLSHQPNLNEENLNEAIDSYLQI